MPGYSDIGSQLSRIFAALSDKGLRVVEVHLGPDVWHMWADYAARNATYPNRSGEAKYMNATVKSDPNSSGIWVRVE